jgi:hypothetical protein
LLDLEDQDWPEAEIQAAGIVEARLLSGGRGTRMCSILSRRTVGR